MSSRSNSEPLPRSRSQGMHYEPLFVLGRGGMGSVHLALAVGRSGFSRLVVIKSCHRELLERPETLQQFLSEARLSARLNHPNVVQVSEVIEAEHGVMLVMEYLDGVSLSTLVRRTGEGFSLPMRLRVLCEALSGLHYAHTLSDFQGAALGIVHRDISPQNVLITYDGRVKLLDFGIAKLSGVKETTHSETVKGRLSYMPAEQLLGAAVDCRSDVYAAGCVLWELIAGRRIWADRSDDDVVRHVLDGVFPSLRDYLQVEPQLERIVVRATARDPDARYPSADAMRSELERCLSSTRAVSARDVGELLSWVSNEAREVRKRAIAEAVAKLERAGHYSAPAASGPPRAPDTLLTSQGATPSQAQNDPDLVSTESLPPQDVGLTLPSFHPTSDPTLGSPELALRARKPRSERPGSGAPQVSSRRRWLVPSLIALAVLTPSLLLVPWARLGRVAAASKTLKGGQFENPAELRRLTLDVLPRDARISVDGQLLLTNPAELRVAPGSESLVRVELPGYATAERRLRVLDDLMFSMELLRLDACR